ncbi:dihydroorotase family protein [Bacillus sp. FJAT-47783]|uniref:dihydroorotase n=1 Tax=Bacillus sp. FJAT-47783 TaxID=2922712 RepID=UPI001FAD559B
MLEGERIDVLIKNGTAFLPQPLENAYIGIADEKIVYINDYAPENIEVQKVIDATDLFILPGLVDSHVHFRTPGQTHKEDFLHGSRAAAAGGVTTIIDMPNTIPPINNLKELKNKINDVNGTSYVDYSSHFLLTNENIDEIKLLYPSFISSVKVFMCGHETAKETVFNFSYLKEVCILLKEKGLTLTAHAEYQPLFRKSNIQTPLDYSKVRDREAAIEAVKMLIQISKETSCHIHILHVSTMEEAKLLSEAKNKGINVTYEFIPPHLTFIETDFHNLGWKYKLSPALRREKDKDYLWDQLIKGNVDTIGSDHAPHTLAEKNGTEPPAGMPGVQELLPVLYSGLLNRKVPPHLACSIIAKLCSENPANMFGIKNKGRISYGYDADLVLFSPSYEGKLSKLYSKCSWSPYENIVLKGQVIMTFLRGFIIYKLGSFPEERIGTYIHEREAIGVS